MEPRKYGVGSQPAYKHFSLLICDVRIPTANSKVTCILLGIKPTYSTSKSRIIKQNNSSSESDGILETNKSLVVV